MTYELEFIPSALKEWKKLDGSIKQQLKKKLAERLENPHIIASRLHGFDCAYKIKLRSSGYRLVYEVDDERVVVIVIATGKREANAVYTAAMSRKTPKDDK